MRMRMYACICMETYGRDVYTARMCALDSCVCIRKVICKYYPCLALSPDRLDSVCVFVLSANLGDLFKKETHVRGKRANPLLDFG